MTKIRKLEADSIGIAPNNHLRAIRFWLRIVIAGLVVSGVTAFPLEKEIRFLLRTLESAPLRSFAELTHLLPWITRVEHALAVTNRDYPFLAYGTDWLAFAHLVIAVAFLGPYREPVRNKWIITFGLIACVGVIPLALIAGQVRGLPIGWRLIDCSFGLFGGIPLILCRRHIAACADDTSRRSKTASRLLLAQGVGGDLSPVPDLDLPAGSADRTWIRRFSRSMPISIPDR